MSYLTKYAPKTVKDLVFHDPQIADLVRKFADGTFVHNIIMSGPPGSGKTSAAKMILKSHLGEDIGDYCLEGAEINQQKIEALDGLRNFQRNSCDRAYFLIDEVEQCTKANRQHLRTFINKNPKVTMICTTNHLSQLEREDPAFVDRFDTAELLVPTLNDWMPRLTAITAAEGVPISSKNLHGLLEHHDASARKLLRETEKVVDELRSSNANAASNSTVLKIQSTFNPKLTITQSNVGGKSKP